MIEFNYNNEIVSSPAVIISGRTSAAQTGLIQLVNNGSKVFPPQFFEVNNGQFKALVHVSPGEPNNFEAHILADARLDPQGFPMNHQNVVDQGSVTLHYHNLQNKPVHLCLVIGSDSPCLYDMPKYKLNKGQVANLDTAIQRLKVAGRMMQAFTQDEFHRLGLSNRCFRFVEEETKSQAVFGYNVQLAVPHSEVKVHVLRSNKTTAEIQSPDWAQQNPKAKDNGGLFSHAIDLVKKSDFYRPYGQAGTAIQCAVMYLDSHWNKSFITAHAALGGGTGEVKMAIFGSHGLHSYPPTFPQISPSFVDATKLSIDEVANDCNQCSTAWECLNICMGAFMHEIGHSFGSPHQTDGVMLRDYMWWNRQFMTREVKCIRDGSPGAIIGKDGGYPKECHWNVRDLMRYFYHDSFSIPSDAKDQTFKKQHSTLMQKPASGPVPLLYRIGDGQVVIKSGSGIFMVEFCGEDLARYHIPYYPKSYGGPGLQHEIFLNFEECLDLFRKHHKASAQDFDLRVLSVAGDLWLPKFKGQCYVSKDSIIRSDFGLGKGEIDGFKTELLGSAKGPMTFIGFDAHRVSKVRVYHGRALDGVSFNVQQGESHGTRTQTTKGFLQRAMDNLNISESTGGNSIEMTFGHKRPHYTDFKLEAGEYITKFAVRNGQWVDAIQIETNTGRRSPMSGNATGGHLSVLEAPEGHQIVGMYGHVGGWVDGLGVVYARI